jgi:hypothetical protein
MGTLGLCHLGSRCAVQLARSAPRGPHNPGPGQPGGCSVSAPSRARGVADEMPVRQRRQVCIGRREPARVWLLHAWRGHAWAVAPSPQTRQRRCGRESPAPRESADEPLTAGRRPTRERR